MVNIEYKVNQGDPLELLDFLNLEQKDKNLITSSELDTNHNPDKNNIDLHIFSLDGRLLFSEENFTNFKVIRGEVRPGNEIKDITLFPEQDSINYGYENGDVRLLYNFLKNLYSTSTLRPFFYIESISPDRSEIRLLSNSLPDEDIVSFTEEIKNRLNNEASFNDFRLNFSKNNLQIAVNIDYEEYNNNIAVLVKLYKPLPSFIQIKEIVRIEELISDSILFTVTAETKIVEDLKPKLKGPNFEIEVDGTLQDTSPLYSLQDLLNFPVTNSFYEVYSKVDNNTISLSIDYSKFESFINFSSAAERLKNFRNKLQLLETYENSIENLKSNNICEVTRFEDLIKELLVNFDHYDKFLYFNSSSNAWPKQNESKPFLPYPVNSSISTNWYNTMLLSASFYDSTNINRLINTIPTFIKDDDNNSSYVLFGDMIGHHFDNLWIYTKSVSKKYDGDNRLNYGIPSNLVKDALEEAGVKLYESGESLQDLYSSLVGNFPTGSISNCKVKEYYIINEDNYVEVDSLAGRFIEPELV